MVVSESATHGWQLDSAAHMNGKDQTLGMLLLFVTLGNYGF